MERNTRLCSAILDAIAQADRPLLPHKMLDVARQHVPGPGIAMVCRNLEALTAEGELKRMTPPGENSRPEHVGHRQSCRRQGRVGLDTARRDLRPARNTLWQKRGNAGRPAQSGPVRSLAYRRWPGTGRIYALNGSHGAFKQLSMRLDGEAGCLGSLGCPALDSMGCASLAMAAIETSESHLYISRR
jgi:hypothetical protein